MGQTAQLSSRIQAKSLVHTIANVLPFAKTTCTEGNTGQIIGLTMVVLTLRCFPRAVAHSSCLECLNNIAKFIGRGTMAQEESVRLAALWAWCW